MIVAAAVGGRRLLPGLLGHDEHLQAVFQVGEADVGVVVQGQDLGVGVHLLEPLGHPAAHHMIGQAAEGLQNDKAAAALFGVVQDLGRGEVEAVQPDAGGDAVAKGEIGQLVIFRRAFGGVLGGGLLDQHDLILHAGRVALGYIDGGGPVRPTDDGFGRALVRKGGEWRRGQHHGSREQQAEDTFFHTRLLFVHRPLKTGQNMDK